MFVDFLKRGQTQTSPVYRYDEGVRIHLVNLPDLGGGVENTVICEFAANGDKKVSHPTSPVDGWITIPDELLRRATSSITIYVVVKGAAVNTVREIIVPVINRPKPMEDNS